MSVNTRRRNLMVSLGLAAAFPGLAGAAVSAKARGKREDLELWYERPAGPWVEALPVGLSTRLRLFRPTWRRQKHSNGRILRDACCVSVMVLISG